MIDSRSLFFLITIFTSQFSLAGQFRDTYNLHHASMGAGQIVEILFQQARGVLPGMQFRHIGHDVAVLFYLVRQHVVIPPDLLADVLDAIPLQQRRPEHQESWGAMLCRGLLNLIPRWPRSDPMVPFTHGGSLQMLTAFTSRQSTGYTREAGGCGADARGGRAAGLREGARWRHADLAGHAARGTARGLQGCRRSRCRAEGCTGALATIVRSGAGAAVERIAKRFRHARAAQRAAA